MMSIFSTSPQMMGARGAPSVGPARFASSTRYDSSPKRSVAIFQTNPNAVVVSPDKPPLAPRRPEESFLSFRSALSETERGSNAGRTEGQRSTTEEKTAEEATASLSRTIHLRFLPTGMKQGALAGLCRDCGEYLRVRICGNATNNQNWIYGFVEFATRDGANRMLKLSGMELPNGPDRLPLRLKCSTAKQRIVDRVFHDANPETGTTCTFGLGSFATRSLKDALESYFSLKTREPPQPKIKQPSPEAWRIHSSVSTPLSPDALSFCPTFGPGGCPFAVGGPTTSIGDTNTARPASSSSGIPQLPISDSDSSDSVPGHPTPWVALPLRICMPSSSSSSSATLFSVTSLPSLPVVVPFSAAGVAPEGDSFSLPFCAISSATGVARGRAFALHALRALHDAYASPFSVSSGLPFSMPLGSTEEAMDALRALLALLDAPPLAGRSAATGAEPYAAELSQRVTQLRLLANLLLALGCLAQRNPTGGMGFVEAVVQTVRALRRAPLQRPDTLAIRRLPGSHSGTGARESNLFDIFADVPENLLFAARSSLPGKEDEEERKNEKEGKKKDIKALGTTDRAALHGYSPSSLGDGVPAVGTLTDVEVCYHRDVDFHGYVLSVLVSAGMAVERVNPLLTRNVSALAVEYAQDVLGMRCAALDALLRSSSESPYAMAGGRLSASVLPELGESHDITAFPRFFFSSLSSDLLTALEDPCEFWLRLPPVHCVRCIAC